MFTWSQPNCAGTQPRSRHRHTATALPNDSIVIWGGIGGGNSVHLFETTSSTWYEPAVAGVQPVARYGHEAVLIGMYLASSPIIYYYYYYYYYYFHVHLCLDFICLPEQSLFFFGGHDGRKSLDDMWELELTTMQWQQCSVSGKVLYACFFLKSFLVA